MTEYALRLENSTDTAPRVRMGDTIPLRHAGVLNARGGVRNDGGGAVSVVAGTMQVQVQPVMAWVDGGSSATQGGYPFVLDAAKNLTLADGHATLARVDTVAIVVRENAYDGSGSTAAAVEVVQGTPGSGAPALPASSVPLRDVNVPAGASAGSGGLSSGNLGSDRRVYLAGGIVRVASQTERDALSKQAGDAVYRADTKAIEVYNGTGWDTYAANGGAWTDYTPAWTAATTNPTIGNGVLAGRYLQTGKRVEAQFSLTLGSTTNRGVGVWSFSLPVAPRDIGLVVGDAAISNGGLMVPASCHGNTGSTIRASRYDGTLLAHNGPVSWATGDTVRFSLSYEAA